MQIRGSPNGARHSPPHLSPPGRHRSERVVVINRNGWSPSIGTGGRHHSVRPLWGSPALLEPNPPLFYSLAWLVIHAGGSAEHIRYVSVIAGSLCVPVAWLIARHAAGDLAGASAALLVATSPPHIAISQYARAYALLVLCVMFAFLCVVRARHSASAMSPAAPAGRL